MSANSMTSERIVRDWEEGAMERSNNLYEKYASSQWSHYILLAIERKIDVLK